MNPDIRTPAARNTDHWTSHAAADEVTASGLRSTQQAAVLAAVTQHPGRTSAELARAAGLDRYAVARRLPELSRWVRKGDARKCEVTGRSAVTWLAE